MYEQETALVICDISGYTRFVTGHGEAQSHAFVVIGQLLKAILEASKHALRLSKLEGDAVFLYRTLSPDRDRRNAELAEVVRACDRVFNRFSERRRELVEANICPCEACVSARGLELKVVVSTGPVVVQRIGKQEELSGLEVIRIHRLLKNSLGRQHYLLITEPTARELTGLDLPEHQASVEHYEELGPCEVRVYTPPLGLSPAATGPRFDTLGFRARDILTKIVIGRLNQFGVVRRGSPAA